MPDWYAELHGAQYAGVSWDVFERWPLWRKARVWAAMTADGRARDERQRLEARGR